MGHLTRLSLLALLLLSACASMPIANGLSKQAAPVSLPPMLVVADGAHVNVRSGPGVEYGVIEILTGPAEKVIYEFNVDWCRISPPLDAAEYVRCQWDDTDWWTTVK